jgi:hypothetical protein
MASPSRILLKVLCLVSLKVNLVSDLRYFGRFVLLGFLSCARGEVQKNQNCSNRLKRSWARTGVYFARGFSRTLDGGSDRMKRQNPISQKEMGFSFFRAKKNV